jgi:hypothetical protein
MSALGLVVFRHDGTPTTTAVAHPPLRFRFVPRVLQAVSR